MPIKKCLDCGAEFYTRSTGLRCEKCRELHEKLATKQRNKEYHKEWYAKNKEKKKATDKAYCEKHREYYREYHRKYYREKIAPKKQNKFAFFEMEVDGKKIILLECPRCKFKAVKLPCGDRHECWVKPPCPHIPKDKEPLECGEIRKDWNWWQYRMGR